MADPLDSGSVEELTSGVIRLPLGEGSRWVWGSMYLKVRSVGQGNPCWRRGTTLLIAVGTKEKVQARNRPPACQP